MKDYKRLCEKLTSELNHVPDIEILTQEIGPPVPADEFADIEDSFDIKLTKDIREFYSQIGFINIEWKFKKLLKLDSNEYVVDGRINVLPLHDVFWGVNDLGWVNILWFEQMDNSTRQRMRNIRPFDFFDEEDNGSICFQLNKDIVSPDLVLYSVDNGYHKLNLNLESYFDLLIQTKGISRWQFLMTKAPVSSNTIFKIIMSDFLPLIFKNTDYKQFMKNIDQFK